MTDQVEPETVLQPSRFRPRLSEQRCLLAKGQTWQADDGTLMFGPDLLDRAWQKGWADEQFFIDSTIGTVLKTGVSAWERIK